MSKRHNNDGLTEFVVIAIITLLVCTLINLFIWKHVMDIFF